MTERNPVEEAWNAGDDEALVRALSMVSLENAFRPRDAFDVAVHPESLRGQVLAIRDAFDTLPRWLRILGRVMAWRPWR